MQSFYKILISAKPNLGERLRGPLWGGGSGKTTPPPPPV